MKKGFGFLLILLTAASCGAAETIAHGGHSLTMVFADIAMHLGNEAHSNGIGSVNYAYKIGKYEVTAEQWNRAAAADSRIGAAAPDAPHWAGVAQPATRMNWYAAAKFCNWLTSGDAHKGVYRFRATGGYIGYSRENALAEYRTVYALPTEHEFVKAAFWTGSGYSRYANGTDTQPSSLAENSGGVRPAPWNVGSGRMEQNGTFDMNGNVSEMLEAALDGNLNTFFESRVRRDTSFAWAVASAAIEKRYELDPDVANTAVGFRVVKLKAARNDPLASEIVLYKSPYPQDVYLATPGIAACPDGRIVATFHVSGDSSLYNTLPGVASGQRCFIYTSDDGGALWTHRANTAMYHARPFVAGNEMYLIGRRLRDIYITKSSDRGETWSAASRLTTNEMWAGSGNNVITKDGYVYLTMDHRIYTNSTAWATAEQAPRILRGRIGTDLLDRANWTFSSSDAFIDYVNDRDLETLFGLPFFPAFYPDRYHLPNAGTRNASPIGWLEGNVVQFVDPRHHFYDPAGKTLHLFLRTNTGLTNIGALMKVTERPDGTMTTSFQQSPSGKEMLFIPLPGGQQTFYIKYDEVTELYWLLATQTTDSLTKGEYLGSSFGAPYDQRRRLHLYFSKNMFDWCSAGPAIAGAAENQSRHCCSMDIHGDDLIFLSRSGDAEAKSGHDCNLITFHRIKNFRSLVY